MNEDFAKFLVGISCAALLLCPFLLGFFLLGWFGVLVAFVSYAAIVLVSAIGTLIK